MTTSCLITTKLNSSSLFRFLLAYRWISLLVASWLLQTTIDTSSLDKPLALLLVLAVSLTFFNTLFYATFNCELIKSSLYLSMDIILATMLLAFSGLAHNLYYPYVLSPLLATALLYQGRGALSAVTIFTGSYLVTIFIVQHSNPTILNFNELVMHLVGAWLITLFVGVMSATLKQFHQAHKLMTRKYNDLMQHHTTLNKRHQQLEVTHELTLYLHSSERQSVQQRLLKAITKDLGFSRAVVGLVNPTLERIDDWQIQPAGGNQSAIAPLPLKPENGAIVQAVLNKQARWCLPRGTEVELEPAIMNEFIPYFDLSIEPIAEPIRSWLGNGSWLILPIVWQQQTVGVLLVAVDAVSPVNLSDNRWSIVTSLVSQAAMSLSTIDRTRRLAVEQERNRIARDIHDTIAQSLFGIVFTLDACIKLLPKQADIVKEELTELRQIAHKMRHQIRQSILDIWPSELTKEEFQADLSKYVTHCSPDHVFNIDFTIDGDFDGLSAGVRRNLYRVSQEALANVARHAGVDSARIYLYVDPEEVNLSVRDKGRGFNPKMVLSREQNRDRFGLRGMKERIETLGGTCNILSQLGHGTQVLVRIPLERRNGHSRNGK